MSGYDPRQQRPATPEQWQGRQQPQPMASLPPAAQEWQAFPQRSQHGPVAWQPPAAAQQRQAGHRQLTAAESFWYVLGCIPMGAMYLCKVPCKKALADAGLAQMTTAEKFWYVLMCIPMGLGYFCKLPVSKALAERY